MSKIYDRAKILDTYNSRRFRSPRKDCLVRNLIELFARDLQCTKETHYVNSTTQWEFLELIIAANFSFDKKILSECLSSKVIEHLLKGTLCYDNIISEQASLNSSHLMHANCRLIGFLMVL